ncbi:MAG: four-carbon acid sugar kinase family protein [Anaerolineae bacterium]|nr:hypothetical protein [Candidatus Roseilinea sp.]MDW8451670.1 four-carbon acid sugar kinase family protein [Anaerolineae bacterium]
MTVSKNDLLAGLPPEWPHDALPEIRRRLRQSGQKVVVLDDDPTGTQTVHDIPVLTEWSVESLRAELANDLPACYILTNSRALPLPQAEALNAAIGRNLCDAGRAVGRPFAVISRSDSTLRGHFPGEVDALADAMREVQGVERNTQYATCRPPYLLIPAFLAGGRYTINDVHYVAYGDDLVPAGETEFARDAAFGYRASNLCAWVEEKTRGAIRAGDVMSITIEDIRVGGPERVRSRLMVARPDGACVVNAASERDLEVVALACLMAEAEGSRFLYRTAASFARARAGIAPKPLLTARDLESLASCCNASAGGLIIVGSYVPKTSGQLDALLRRGVNAIEVSVEALLDDAARSGEVARCAQAAEALLASGCDVVIYTSRRLISGADAATSLAIGRRVSDSLVAIVRSLAAQPRYVLAKGGITSSDIATKGLDVRRAMVLGQLLPGVPVWRLGSESRYPGTIYVVFPGNVGGPDALAQAYDLLRRDPSLAQ